MWLVRLKFVGSCLVAVSAYCLSFLFFLCFQSDKSLPAISNNASIYRFVDGSIVNLRTDDLGSDRTGLRSTPSFKIENIAIS